MLEARIEQAISNQVQSYRERLRTWKLRPVLIDPFIVFHQWGKDLKKLDKALLQAWTLSMQGKTQEVKRLKETLLALSPKAVLNRGYHLSMKKDGTLITSIEALEVDETMTTMMQDGTIESIVKKKGKL
jgi:exodeoxyribonuclease VII large subunit